MTSPPRTPTMREAMEAIKDMAKGPLPWDRHEAVVMRTQIFDIARAALAAEESGWLPTHRHYKGGLYRVIGDAQHSEDGSKLIVYQGEDRRIWVRPRAMFHEQLADGQLRFSPLPPAPAPKEPR